MENLDLDAIRSRIDKLDAQLVALLEERMEAVLEVAAYKKRTACLCLMQRGKRRSLPKPAVGCSIRNILRQ